MVVSRPSKVPQARITSIDVVSFDGGLDQRGEANIRSNSFSVGTNVMVDNQGLATHRFGLKKWLPDTVGTAYQVYPVIYGGILYYFTADDGKIKYCKEGDTSWTNCGGSNTITTGVDIPNTFKRFLNKVIILNGVDNLGYVDLATKNVVKFSLVADPTSAPTGALTVLTNTPYKVYYAISYNSVVGKTKLSPILTQGVSKIRDQWKSDGTEGVTITDPNTRPSGAVSWNVYFAAAPAGGTIAPSDMLPLALGLDINTTTFFDNGQLDVQIDAGTAPLVNSTQGPKAKYCVDIDGRPFLFGIKDDEYAIMIGGDGDYALDFSENNGGYRLVLNQGTNYYPTVIVGFRNGQGLPSITALFSNTEGLSKQSIIEQSTISLGNYSARVWGASEQNYGAANVSSSYATVNYRGNLVFPTSDGILQINTQASLQNVLLPTRISDPISDEVNTIKTGLLNKIVGTAWANRVFFTVPARGFDKNNKILVYDMTRRDAETWYVFDVAAQWIGTISPPSNPGFVYIAQDNHFFKLEKSYVAVDETSTGGTQPFPVELTTDLIGSNTAHAGYFAVVQAVFYLVDFIGSATLIVRWRDYQSGKMKTKTKTISNGTYAKSSISGWSSSGYQYNQNVSTKVLRWKDVDVISDSQSTQKESIRVRVPLNNVITNEMQATIAINLDNSAMRARSISFEGQGLGISPDVR